MSEKYLTMRNYDFFIYHTIIAVFSNVILLRLDRDDAIQFLTKFYIGWFIYTIKKSFFFTFNIIPIFENNKSDEFTQVLVIRKFCVHVPPSGRSF